MAKTPAFLRSFSLRFLLFLIFEVLLVSLAYWHGNIVIGTIVLVLGIGVILWRARRDQSRETWGKHGGYEIRETKFTITILDADAKRVIIRKTQKLVGHQRNVTEVPDEHVASDGTVVRVQASPGTVLTPMQDGVHYTYVTKLPGELPVGKRFERWFEIEYDNPYPNPNRETHVAHVPFGVRKMEVVFRFHQDKAPTEIHVRNRGLRQNDSMDHLLVDVHGDRTEWSFVYDRPENGSEFAFEWRW